MTPLESFGIRSLYGAEHSSILVFFYGASSLMVYDPFTTLIKGIFVVLFSASLVIFMFVFSFLRVAYF